MQDYTRKQQRFIKKNLCKKFILDWGRNPQIQHENRKCMFLVKTAQKQQIILVWILINNYTINQVILAFWFVLAYDLLEDRYMIDVITTKFFFLHFKMAESFEK